MYESICTIVRPVVHHRTTVVRLVETSISHATPYNGRTNPLATIHDEKGCGQLPLNFELVQKLAATHLRALSLARLAATSEIDCEILLRSPADPPQFWSQIGLNAYVTGRPLDRLAWLESTAMFVDGDQHLSLKNPSVCDGQVKCFGWIDWPS